MRYFTFLLFTKFLIFHMRFTLRQINSDHYISDAQDLHVTTQLYKTR